MQSLPSRKSQSIWLQGRDRILQSVQKRDGEKIPMTQIIGNLNQSERIRRELLSALDSGITYKQQLYNIVAEKTESPRPTVRRVASSLKKQLERHHQILANPNHTRNIATDYDCPTCLAKRVIKRTDNRCPKCQQYLDWSDVE